jgi:hypothetical protein
MTSTRVDQRVDLLLIAGRSGAGKSAVAAEVSSQLKRANLGHCQIDGDWIDLCFPQAPPELFDRNFRDLWRNYQSFGCSRLIYSNFASIRNLERIVGLMGGPRPRIIAVRLTCSDETALQRIRAREHGGGLEWHLTNVDAARANNRHMDSITPDWVPRVTTDGRTVEDIAAEVVALTRWTEEVPSRE